MAPLTSCLSQACYRQRLSQRVNIRFAVSIAFHCIFGMFIDFPQVAIISFLYDGWELVPMSLPNSTVAGAIPVDVCGVTL